ncbi:helix-turn-helix transcriptional regulator [Micromonospora echinofusca]|uniref:AAA family ATPase n=1 Tax=Micromonospora echinofusca TaxID=47858 RepID=A0ABS3VSH8_MICEH|nr:LuxR family transcriptional regulator [Micromonospora echinofusca]MBO4207418.1 AAA family ATPase [Micromonospora echinofusca]
MSEHDAVPSDRPTHTEPPLVGRAELLDYIAARTAAGRRVLLTGPNGIGKSALLGALAATARERGERVLHLTASESDRWMPCAALADLLRAVPETLVHQLPDTQRAAVDAIQLRAHGGTARDSELRAGRIALCAIFERYAADGPALLLFDDAHWIDAASTDVIGYALRRLASPVLAAVAVGTPESRFPPAAEEIPVPALSVGELTELLTPYGLPARLATKVHTDSGGNPFLALALAGALTDRSSGDIRPVQLPRPLRTVIAERLRALPKEVRRTLLTAALAVRPTADLLRRAGHDCADDEITTAVAAGLLVCNDHEIHFTPPAVASVVAQSASAAERTEAHRVLAAVTDAASRIRHRTLASTDSEARPSRGLAAAAEAALRSGARALAAELYLLAADRTPVEASTERFEWLATAAEVGAAGSLPDPVYRSAEAVLSADAPRAHRVRVRLALVDLASQALAAMEEVLACALEDAEGDPALMAQVRLRLSWARMVCGDSELFRSEAIAAATLARVAQDPATEAMALTMQALAARVTARPAEAEKALAAALALPGTPPPGLLHMAPRFHAARFAFFDDRLVEARTDLLRMLSHVERGKGDELVVVLRSLSEVAARMGCCRDALDYAHRAMRVARECGTSPGPTWYTRAVAELAGGSLARAAALAERGIRASKQEHDTIYLERSLHALGQALIRSGRTGRGVQVLQRVRSGERGRGLSAPFVLRWHGDLALGLASLGRPEEAENVIAEARAAMKREVPDGSGGAVAAQLARAEAVVATGRGDPNGALALLDAAQRRLAELGQPLEEGHCLLERSHIERRQRRFAAARRTASLALELFAGCEAHPWAEQAARALARCETLSRSARRIDGSTAKSQRPFMALTATEEQIAVLVGTGATNREVASQMFISTKTVEGTLTRVYRKLGVRSRTQLCSLLQSMLGADGTATRTEELTVGRWNPLPDVGPTPASRATLSGGL